MASSQIKISNPPQGISMIAIKGAIHHLIGPLVPAQDEQHQFAQLYIIDNHDTQVNLRMSHLGGADSKLNNEVLRMLQNMLHQYNPFVQQFRQVIDMINDNERLIEYQIVINTDGSVDHRRYNRPTGHGQDELAGYIPGDEVNVTTDHRSIQIRARGIQNDATHGLQYISDIHCNYDSLHFVLFHPQGEFGWYPGIQRNPSQHHRTDRNDGTDHENRHLPTRQRHVSSKEYAAFFMHDRVPPDNALFIYGKRLFQEWLVDEFSKVESQHLGYLRTHQNELHVEQYHLFADAVANREGQVGNIGRPIILPSSHTGSPRHMNQLFQDAMAIVRSRGTPSLFLTYTCNPNWIEIRQELKDGEVPNDRPDLICRVFKMKFDEFMKDVTKRNAFGKVIAHIHVIEFQKRGLPHAHILPILSSEDRPRTTDDYDKFVCAMLPDKNVNPILYKNVTSFMLHGPCGALNPNSPCMKDGKCKFHYPRPFANETTEPTKKANPFY